MTGKLICINELIQKQEPVSLDDQVAHSLLSNMLLVLFKNIVAPVTYPPKMNYF